jgi:hypothetical protein
MKIRFFTRVQWNTSVNNKEFVLDFDQPAEQRELVGCIFGFVAQDTQEMPMEEKTTCVA